jgi:hypothetical protein
MVRRHQRDRRGVRRVEMCQNVLLNGGASVFIVGESDPLYESVVGLIG